jgi:hypothetical protein
MALEGEGEGEGGGAGGGVEWVEIQFIFNQSSFCYRNKYLFGNYTVYSG